MNTDDVNKGVSEAFTIDPNINPTRWDNPDDAYSENEDIKKKKIKSLKYKYSKYVDKISEEIGKVLEKNEIDKTNKRNRGIAELIDKYGEDAVAHADFTDEFLLRNHSSKKPKIGGKSRRRKRKTNKKKTGKLKRKSKKTNKKKRKGKRKSKTITRRR